MDLWKLLTIRQNDFLLLYFLKIMIKIFLKIFAVFVFFIIFSARVSAQELLVPSLSDTLLKNQKMLEENAKNAEKANIPSLSPQFTPADNFSYETIYSGSAIVIKKALGTELYVQDVNFASGAYVASSLEVAAYNEETGEPQFVKKNPTEAKRVFLREPTFMINGQFFNPATQPSELSFSLKTDGEIRTAGADDRGESKNILHIASDFAEILPYSWKNLVATTGSFAMGNLSTRVPKYKDENIGRTYICTPDVDAKNRSSRVLVFVARAMSE